MNNVTRMTWQIKEYVGWETEEEDVLTENEDDWGSRKG